MAMHLANAISYITDGEKTQGGILVGSHNCSTDTALQEMLATKRKFGKLDKRQGYHFIISFKNQEVRPETAMELTQKFVERFLGDDFQCLYATHDNTRHVHSHIIFNSVSWRNGRKYRYEKGDWARKIQPIVNDLCKEYGLSIQDIEIGAEKEQKKWDKTKQGPYKWNHQIRLDVEDSISFATDHENFLKLMEVKGYEIRQKDGETYLKPMGEKRFLALTDISEHYTEKIIAERIEKGIFAEKEQMKNKSPRMIRYRKNYRKYIPPSSYQKAFLAKMYRTGQLKRQPYSRMWKYRKEAVRFEHLQAQYLYLCRHDIRSVEELKERKEYLSLKADALSEKRKQVYKKRYPYKAVIALLKTIEENETRASYYQAGSTFYAPYDEKYREALKGLEQAGYTRKQAEALRESFQTELAQIQRARKVLKKEDLLIEGILTERRAKVITQERQEPQTSEPAHFKIDQPRTQRKEERKEPCRNY